MDELQDLVEEWDLTLGTVSDETREVYRHEIGRFDPTRGRRRAPDH